MDNNSNNLWLTKAINPTMAIAIVILSFVYYFIITFSNFKDSARDIVMYVLGSVSTIVTMVVSYYFGSSKSSADKSEYIEKIKQQEQGEKHD